MVSRLFSTAGSIISQVGEVLAPTVHSPLEDLRDHWKAVRKFYIDENENDVEAFQSSQLPEHLVAMVSILVEEEATLGDTGPCVEFFLQNKILETICLLAERDSPQGVRKLVLQTVAILLGDVSIPLLPHMSVHRPVRNLIRRMILNPQAPSSILKETVSPPPDSEFVTLLETLTNKLMKDPSIIGFFTDDIHFEEGDLLVFQGLLKHLWDPGSVGDRARRGTANCLLLPTIDILSKSTTILPPANPLSTPASDSTVASPQTEPQTQTTPTQPEQPTQPATETSNILHQSVNWKVFITKQISSLVSTYRKLPLLSNLPTVYQPQSIQLLDNCKNRIGFCSQLATLPRTDISDFLISEFEEQFLDGTLGPALLHPNEPDAVSAMIYLREILPCCSAALLDTIFKFLLGNFVGPERKEDADVHLLRHTLISRINATNEYMSIAACRFFSSLIGLHNSHVMHNLVLRNLLPSSPSPTTFRRTASPSPNRTTKREDTTLESLQPSITRFLTVFGSKFAQITPPSSAVTSPILTRISSPIPLPSTSSNDDLNSNATNSPPLDTENSTSNSSTNTIINSKAMLLASSVGSSGNLTQVPGSPGATPAGNFELVGGGVGYDSYLVDAQHQVTIYKAACKDWPHTAVVPTQAVTYVGAFMEQVLLKLSYSLDQDLDMNLVVTGLFAKLCYCPVLALTMYLLSYQPNVISGVPTLYGTVDKLLQEIETRSKSFVNISACIERARNEMAEPTPSYDHSFNKVPHVSLTFNPKRYLQAVIVLEEFCKELAAILQAKVVFGLGVEKKGLVRNIQ